MPDSDETVAASKSSTRAGWIRLAVLIVLVGGVVAGYWRYGHLLTLDNFAAQETKLRELENSNPALVYGAAFTLYVVVTGLSLPGAAALTLVFAWYFKFVKTLVIVSFASTLGASCAFLLSRYLLRESLERKFGKRLSTFNEALEREGAFYLFTLRLIPAVPFFVINVVMGLTRIRLWTFWWVSQVGMLAGTIVYTYAGTQIPDLNTLSVKGIKAVFTPGQLTSITAAFVLLGVFPLIVKRVLALVVRGKQSSQVVTQHTDETHELPDDSNVD